MALYRPGPMESIPKFVENKFNPGKVTYKTPLLEPILKVTYGCIVYQEQVIEIFRTLGGYSMGQADNIRRAISKKKQKIIDAERKTFVYGDREQKIDGCIARGVPEAVAQSIYDEIVDFANYAFNKAHAVCYAVVAYQTAYLKCHYPRQYMAALMTSRSGLYDQNLRLYRRVQGAGNPGSAAGHQPFRGLFHRRGRTPSASASAR